MEIRKDIDELPIRICKLPPLKNDSLLSLASFSKGFHFVKRNLLWIGVVSLFGFFGFIYLLIRIQMSGWSTIGIEISPVDILITIGIGGFVLTVVVLFIKSYSAPQSGHVPITRSKSDSVDGFGAIRGYDYSHVPSGFVKHGIPVSQKTERERTATFREGAKDHLETEET